MNTFENTLAFQGRDGVLTGSLESAHQRFDSVFKNSVKRVNSPHSCNTKIQNKLTKGRLRPLQGEVVDDRTIS